MTLNAQLSALGLTTRPAGHGRKHVLDGDRVVCTGRAHDVWLWLRAEGMV